MGSDESKPSLEAPSLGFRRRRKSAKEADPVAPGEPVEPVAVEPVEPLEPVAEEPVAEEPAAEEPAAEEPVAPAPLPAADGGEQTAALDQPTVADAATVTEPAPDGTEVDREPEPEPEVEQATEPRATEDLPAAHQAEPTPELAPDRDEAPRRRARRTLTMPRLSLDGHLAAALTGLVVGAFLVLATAGGLGACEAVRGTSSCGGGPGSALLLVIVVVAILLGAGLLRWAQVASAGSISVLAVAIVCVLGALFVLDALDGLAAGLVIGALTVAAYSLAHFVTTRFIDDAA